MIYIGLDNGVNGGIVYLNKKLEIVSKHVMPVIGTTRKEYDLVKLAKLLNKKNAKVFLEKAQPRYKDGSKQAFKTGYGYGAIQGMLIAMQIPHILISPKQWQKKVFEGLSSTDTKQASLMFCQRTWPKEDWTPTQRSQKAHNGLTDAACIAYYGVTNGL